LNEELRKPGYASTGSLFFVVKYKTGTILPTIPIIRKDEIKVILK
jgi:hypothetical protein